MKLPRPIFDLCLQLGTAGERLLSNLFLSVGFGTSLVTSALISFRHPRRIKWRSVGYYMDSCGSDAMLLVSLLGLLIGVILAFQAIIQLGRYGVESYVVNLVGTVVVTELAPLLTAVVLAGRTGSAFAAEIGTMKGNEELDALVTLGVDVGEFLLIPKIIALMLVLPGLTIIADVCGVVGGMFVVCADLDFSVSEYLYRSADVISVLDMTQGLVKSAFFGLIVAAAGCMKGINADRDAAGVGNAATGAVVSSIFLIVCADAALTGLFSLVY